MKYAVGDTVAVCYDGKWSRAVEGRVVRVDADGEIKVRFLPWANEEVGFVELLCGYDDSHFGGYITGAAEHGIMMGLGFQGDWYSVRPTKDLTEREYPYELAPYDRKAK